MAEKHLNQALTDTQHTIRQTFKSALILNQMKVKTVCIGIQSKVAINQVALEF